MASFVFTLLVAAPSLGLAARVKTAAASETCPLGFVCTPAACDIPNSNGWPGLDCACADGFQGSISWKLSSVVKGVHYHTPEGSCATATCGIVGTEGDGPNCKCKEGLDGEITWNGPTASGECMLEAKALFTEGEEKTWDHNGKSFKCCVSTAGKPTMVQDMNADLPVSSEGFKIHGEHELLQGGARRKQTGCGYMFGESYHNGMKAYRKLFDMKGVSREDPTCPIPIQMFLDASGVDVDTVMEEISSKTSSEEAFVESSA